MGARVWGLSARVKDPDQTMSLPLEMQDTFSLYGEETLERVIGLNRSDVDAVPPALRASLVFYQAANGRKLVPSLRSVPASWRASLRQDGDGDRFVWWPNTLVPSLRSVSASWRASLRQDGDGHRFVWWPNTLVRYGDDPLLQFVAHDLVTSRHDQVPESIWERARGVLPLARRSRRDVR